MELVGQHSTARAAARASSSLRGWTPTAECPSTATKDAGATCRQVSQSMHVLSTKKPPGAFSA